MLCSCDGPPHPYSPGWCRPPGPQTSSVPSRDVAHIRGDSIHAATVAEAEAWAEKLRDDIHWARTPEERTQKQKQLNILEHLIQWAR